MELEVAVRGFVKLISSEPLAGTAVFDPTFDSAMAFPPSMSECAYKLRQLRISSAAMSK